MAGEDSRSRRESLSEGGDDGAFGADDVWVDELVGSHIVNGGAGPDAFAVLSDPGLHPVLTAGVTAPAPGMEVPVVEGASDAFSCWFCRGGVQLSHGALLADASTSAPSATLGVDGEESRSKRDSLSEGDDDGGLGEGDDWVDALVGSQMANGGAEPDVFDWLLLPALLLVELDPGPHPFFTAGFALPAPGIEVPSVDGASADVD